MAGMFRITILLVLVAFVTAPVSALDALDATGEPRYGRHALAPGFAPSPFSAGGLSGGDVDLKSLGLGANCLGYAASSPDFVVALTAAFERVTFLVASDADTTLAINLPNGSWACDDDTNGLNPALVFHGAAAGDYRIWLGSYTQGANDESALYVSEAGPETLPTTATGPDPGRDALYGEATLAAGFQPSPFALQLVGGGRNRVSDFITQPVCPGFVSEAPDFSVILDDAFREITFAVYSHAAMTLLVNAADGSWHCSDAQPGERPGIRFHYPLAGLYDVWVGSADEDNYAAAILRVTEHEAELRLPFTIDASCPGLREAALQVGRRAVVADAMPSGASLHAQPETASTVVFRAPPGSALELVGGPVCKGGQRWWRARLGEGAYAWVADGDASGVWLAPE